MKNRNKFLYITIILFIFINLLAFSFNDILSNIGTKINNILNDNNETNYVDADFDKEYIKNI